MFFVFQNFFRYMLVKGHGESPVLRKPELDAFLATAMSPELRNVTYLAEMRLEMVTIRGVHLAAIFMQVCTCANKVFCYQNCSDLL